jgi:nitroreductase
MELLQGIETRRSYRAFKPNLIPKEIIEKILEAGRRSPSCSNSQPWEVVVVTGDKKNELSGILCEMAEADVTPNPDFSLPEVWPAELDKRVKEHGAKRYKVLGVEREDVQSRKMFRLLNFKFYGAPCVMFLFLNKGLTSYSVFDMGLFAQTLILAAHSFEVGSCIQAVLSNYPDAIRKFLGISANKIMMLGISMGYPDMQGVINKYESSRVSTDCFVQWCD